MTITIAWWALSLVVVIVGVLAGIVIMGRAGTYDFVTPMIGLAVIGMSIAAAVGIMLGWVLS